MPVGSHQPPPAVDLLGMEKSGWGPCQSLPAAITVIAGSLGVRAAGQHRQREHKSQSHLTAIETRLRNARVWVRLSLPQRLTQIVDQVFEVLQANGRTQQILRSLCAAAFYGCTMLD